MPFHLDDLALFGRIAALGSLSAAARERNVPVSQVTRTLQRLEAACGVRLMHRSTHGLSLSDEGDTLLRHGQELLETAEALNADLQVRKGEPSGWVRVSASASLAEAVLVPSLPELGARYPRLRVDLVVEDPLADLARDGIDIALRTGQVQGEQLVARTLATTGRRLYASPAYLARHPPLQHPDELAGHHLIAHRTAPRMNLWPRCDGGPPLQVTGQTVTDNAGVLLSMVRHGVGIARLLEIVARPWVQRGELVPVLPGHFDLRDLPVYAVMRPERHRLPKVRACLAHWAACLEEASIER